MIIPMDAEVNARGPADRRAQTGQSKLAAGATVGGRFQIRQYLGLGSLGERYRALDTKTDRPIDIRILIPGLLDTSNALERLRQQIQRASQLSHKNIAATYGLGREGDLHFIATEFVDGETLR